MPCYTELDLMATSFDSDWHLRSHMSGLSSNSIWTLLRCFLFEMNTFCFVCSLKISFQDAGWCCCLANSTYEAPCFPEWNRTRALLIAPALWRHNGSRIWLATDDDSLKEPRDREGHNIPAYLSVYTLANIQELTFFAHRRGRSDG